MMISGKGRVAVIGNAVSTLLLFRGPLIRAMTSRGIDVHALVPDIDQVGDESIRALGAHPVQIAMNRSGLNPWSELLSLTLLERTIERVGPDCILAYFVKPSIYASLVARWRGDIRHFCIIEGAGYVFDDKASQRSRRRRLLRALVCQLYRTSMKRASGVFFLNADDHDLFVQERMVAWNQAIRLPGIGIDLDHYETSVPKCSPITFLMVARLLVEKGVVQFVEAARIVKAQHPHSRFILLGGIDANPSSLSEGQVRAWVEEGVIEWPGRVADVRPWVRDSSVFVLPSFYREGMPRSTLEAMSMGRPIITTDVPGCRETVVHGENGFRIPARSVSALVEAMSQLIKTPDLIGRMGQASRRRAESRYDVHGVNAMMLEAMGLWSGECGARSDDPGASRRLESASAGSVGQKGDRVAGAEKPSAELGWGLARVRWGHITFGQRFWTRPGRNREGDSDADWSPAPTPFNRSPGR